MSHEYPAATTGEPAPHAPEAKTSRAGRNLPAAFGMAIILLGVLAASLAFRPEPFVALVCVAVALALHELHGAFKQAGLDIAIAPLMVGGIGMVVAAFVGGSSALLVAFVLTVAAITAWQLIDGARSGALRDVCAGVFACAYVPLLAAFVVLMLDQPRGAWRIAMFILLAVFNDTGGYAAGVLFGKHPMAPSISPKKSWEGFAGSVLFTSLIAIFGSRFVLYLPWLPEGGYPFWRSAAVFGLGLGVVAALIATIGDLSESLIKRDLGIKDMSTLIPGHGGVMDRVDSILFLAPFAFLAFEII
jgi:phosphatidate cytidylyltransferase